MRSTILRRGLHRALSLGIAMGLAMALGIISGAQAAKPDNPGGGGGGGGDGLPPAANVVAPKNAFNIMMNYELGMHCTGFEFSYCCVLPPYNSILAQVVKTEKTSHQPVLLEADPVNGVDGLGRPTVMRDKELDANGDFKKYVLR
ncbi:MAG: hypothetical protein OEY87_09385, partial [Gammaproteobacteria bacterium]|nr:hypothetical protein [Gammaproteobacteria bacterium]